jgi:hypothetical protein
MADPAVRCGRSAHAASASPGHSVPAMESSSAPDSLSTVSRALTVATAVAFFVLGIVLFFGPDLSSSDFAWKVSPFVVMTMGGWCAGVAGMAGLAAYVWRWAEAAAALVFAWTFCVGQLVVLATFSDRVTIHSTIAWAYLGALVLGAVSAVAGVADWARRRPTPSAAGRPYPRWMRVLAYAFIVVVGLIALGGFIAGPNGATARGGIFPETLSTFTMRAFAAFFAALVIGTVPVARSRIAETGLLYTLAGECFIVPILAAATWHWSAFDLGKHPGGLLYLGLYVVVGVVAAVVLVLTRYRPVPFESRVESIHQR